MKLTSFTRLLSVGAAVCVLTTVSGRAKAVDLTQTFTFLNYGAGQIGENTDITTTGDLIHATTGTFAGRYLGMVNGGPVFNIFCTDVTHDIGWGQSYLTLLDPGKITDSAQLRDGQGYYNGAAPGGLASALTALDYKPDNLGAGTFGTVGKRASAVAWLADTYMTAAISSHQAAGIQLAIWDILQDGGDGIGAGLFESDFSDSSLVNTYEGQAALHTSYTTTGAYWIEAPRDASYAHLQDFVTTVQGPGTLNVPEPGALGLLAGSGAAGLLLAFRRKGALRRR